MGSSGQPLHRPGSTLRVRLNTDLCAKHSETISLGGRQHEAQSDRAPARTGKDLSRSKSTPSKNTEDMYQSERLYWFCLEYRRDLMRGRVSCYISEGECWAMVFTGGTSLTAEL